MNIYKTLNPEHIKGMNIPMNAIILSLDNGMKLVSTDFQHSRKWNLELLVWLPEEKKWVKTYAKNTYTEYMWNFWRKHQPKRNKNFRRYENMMKHDRKQKHGSGGERIHNGSITDYECAKVPLHDFRRVFICV